MKRSVHVGMVTLVLTLALGTVSTVVARNLNPGIAPPHSNPHGHSYGEWAAAWTQWALGIPADDNPVTDSTGENASVGQSGPVWFLAGNFGGTTVRECVVPEGKALLFPLLNYFWVTTPSDPPMTLEEIQAGIRAPMDNAILSCTIDGRPVNNPAAYRCESPVFTVTVPDDNLFGIDAGTYGPCLNNGYYLLLEPLKKGVHIIHFTGQMADGSFSLDVTYRLYVGKEAQIVPPGKRYRGKTYSEWVTAWWQWVVSIPADRNPVSDTTGEFCNEGQSGPVWFMPGSWGSSAERYCSMPAGKPIFMPVFNWIFGAGVYDCEPTVPGTPCDVAVLEQGAAVQTLKADILDVSIDGVPVRNVARWRSTSGGPFPVTYPENSVVGPAAGTYFPQVADGYWLMIEPMAKGAHEINIHVRAPGTMFGLIEFTLVIHLWVGGPEPKVLPPQATFEGKTLTEWMSTYWRWFYGTASDPAQGQVGHVRLLPLPVGELISGSGTPADPALYRGRLELTLPPGTPFVLPEFSWVGERYDGYPAEADDLPIADAELLAGVHPTLFIDGVPVMTDANKADYYVPMTPFDPIVMYPVPSSYGSVAALFLQGAGIVSAPLSPGMHVIHLYEPYVIPGFFGVIYDNTWVITVAH